MYTNTYYNFHKNLIHYPRIFNGNSNSVVTNHIDFQIHKSPGRNAFTQGFRCLLGQSAGEKLRQTVATSKQTLCRAECSTLWRSRLLRHTFLDEIRSGLSPYGEAECTLPTVSGLRAKSRQRAGSRSGIRHLRPGHTSRALPELYTKPYPV